MVGGRSSKKKEKNAGLYYWAGQTTMVIIRIIFITITKTIEQYPRSSEWHAGRSETPE